MTRRLAIWLATACLVILMPSTAWADPSPSIVAVTGHGSISSANYGPQFAPLGAGGACGCWIASNPGTGPAWLEVEFSSAFYVTGYTFGPRPDLPADQASSWVLKGSINGTEWTTVDTVTANTFPTAAVKAFDVDTPTTVKFLKWDDLRAPTGNNLSMSRLVVEAGSAPVPSPTPTPSASSTPAPTVTATVTAPPSEVVTVVDNAQALETELSGPELVGVAAVGLCIAFLSSRVVLSL